MPLDLLASARSTALIALATVAVASPVVVKGDVVDGVGDRLRGPKVEHTDTLVAGNVEFAVPEDWGQLGATGAQAKNSKRIGTVVTAVCPAGGEGSRCKDDVQLTFVAYSGRKGHELPILSTFEAQLDDRLADAFNGFRKGQAEMRPGADGLRYLDYPFAWRTKGGMSRQRYAAYRNNDGSGVVVIAAGTGIVKHSKAISEFLATGHEPTSDAGAH